MSLLRDRYVNMGYRPGQLECELPYLQELSLWAAIDSDNGKPSEYMRELGEIFMTYGAIEDAFSPFPEYALHRMIGGLKNLKTVSEFRLELYLLGMELREGKKDMKGTLLSLYNAFENPNL